MRAESCTGSIFTNLSGNRLLMASWVHRLAVRAPVDNRFLMIQVAIARLKLGLEPDLEVREIDKLPAGEVPSALAPFAVRKADDEVVRVVVDLVGLLARR